VRDLHPAARRQDTPRPRPLRAIITETLAAGTFVVCHDTLSYSIPDYGAAICRGFLDAYAGQSPALIFLLAFQRLTEVPPPGPGSPGAGRRPAEKPPDLEAAALPRPQRAWPGGEAAAGTPGLGTAEPGAPGTLSQDRKAPGAMPPHGPEGRAVARSNGRTQATAPARCWPPEW
jgi:hypothetical protein